MIIAAAVVVLCLVVFTKQGRLRILRVYGLSYHDRKYAAFL